MNTWETDKHGLGARNTCPCWEIGLNTDWRLPDPEETRGARPLGQRQHIRTYTHTLDTLKGGRGAHLRERGTGLEMVGRHLHSVAS